MSNSEESVMRYATKLDEMLDLLNAKFGEINQDINIVVEQVALLTFNNSNKSLETTEEFRDLMKRRSIEVDPG